jgi:RloB-like protein
MRRRSPTIKPRTPVFLGCEGESEQSYGQFLNDVLNEKRLPFHIEVVNLSPGAGDPRTRLIRAHKEINKRARNRIEFGYMAVLMDSDQIDGDAGRREELEAVALDRQIAIIWQSPCHEAFLLKHFEGCVDSAPPTSNLALRELRRVWPEYVKPMTRQQLRQKIGFEDAVRLSRRLPSLSQFLQSVSLI